MFPVVFFDLDGTLLRGTSVSVLTAEWLGRGRALDRLEEDYRAVRISNSVLAESSATWFTGRRPSEVSAVLEEAPWIRGIGQTVTALREAGSYVALATVTWRFAADAVAARYGFDATCGTEMNLKDGRLSGEVSRHFDGADKAAFVRDVCERRGVPLERAAVVGDSRSDLPAFAIAGYSIALNADEAAREAATVTLETDDLRDVLPLLLR